MGTNTDPCMGMNMCVVLIIARLLSYLINYYGTIIQLHITPLFPVLCQDLNRSGEFLSRHVSGDRFGRVGLR